MPHHALLSRTDAVYVINLPERGDRRDEMAAELARVGLSLDAPPVVLFPAVRPEAPDGFPSIGARGCFLSHLGILRDALQRGLARIVILEDDADFTDAFVAMGADRAEAIDRAGWDIVYFGYEARKPIAGVGAPGDDFVPVPAETGLGTTHAMMLRQSAIARLVPYLEAMLARPPGDPDGGPMHVDGAYSWFRRQAPELRTLAAREQLIVQRSSRTDIGERKWQDRLPFAARLRKLRNRLRPH
ncbi:glycosyl transferase family 25 [Rhodovulum iodosum]|uniref:Glycosyl transferase family 25 n=1 Tax=Rhodovulum iodosum TaxID=68291 RepID=A0ABV3Y0Z1_9RHOB|nr:glycosyltransferase family 25 protein [Rhodovulum robiginosum]RSK38876.1 glycosyltransferase family 25 protein [Rhodovulum robiginosum]